MAGPKDVILEQLKMSGWLLEQLTTDLTDAEYFKPAVPKSNHAAWVLGHLAVSEDKMVAALLHRPQVHSASLAEQFLGGGDTSCHPDASHYPNRNEMDAMFRDTRNRTVEALLAFDERKWDEPAPEGYPKEFFPTAGSLWGLIAVHAFWHIGQITTCRVALNKKRVLE